MNTGPVEGTILVTGLPRSGTSWVGKMLEASGQLVYVNEPMNPRHPPGRSPGVLDASVQHYFEYICADNEAAWTPALRRTAELRFGVVREVQTNRTAYDLARAGKYFVSFTSGRLRGRRALLDDPYALLSAAWLIEHVVDRAVVLVRDPVSFVGSWHALGWGVDTAELLNQPLLMRDHLEPLREELEASAGSEDWLAAACLLWKAAYTVVHNAVAGRPEVLVRRYEDLAGEPLAAFEDLYHGTGLVWDARVAARIRLATTAAQGRERGFAWTLRGGPSRTAYRPLDSRQALARAQSRLDTAQARRVRQLTAGVKALFYDD